MSNSNESRGRKRLAVFASGSGSNFEAIASACSRGDIDAEVCALVCDKPGAYVLERAKRYPQMEVIVVSPRNFKSRADYESEILRQLSPLNPDLVCLAGYMRIVGETLLEPYRGRIINIHPALLPSFKGAHAIRDAFEFGVKVFGVTIHYVDETLDGGKIISQAAVPYTGTDIDELETMIHAAEHPLYVATIRELLENKDEKK